MNVTICSRKEAEALIDQNAFPKNTAVISFYDPANISPKDYRPLDYSKTGAKVCYIEAQDIDWDSFKDTAPIENQLINDIDALADFIFHAHDSGMDIICQCDYGQSRSAGCAAAILEFYYNSGRIIFEDIRYFTNQMIFAEVLQALLRKKGRKTDVQRCILADRW